MNSIEKLRELLGAESGDTWIGFMDFAYSELGSVLKRGKPSQEAIQESIIGRSGFSSWSEMIEAPTASNGLGWNVSAWNAWKRAYGVIQRYPYLRDLEITASAVNTLWRETKPDFPADLASFEEYQVRRTTQLEYRRQNSLKDAQNYSSELVKTIAELRQEKLILEQQVADLKERQLNWDRVNGDLSEEIGELRMQLEHSNESAAGLNKTLGEAQRRLVDSEKLRKRSEAELKRFRNMGFVEKMRFALNI